MVKITLPDGKKLEVTAGSTLKEVAEKIGKKLAQDALAAEVDGKVLDLLSKVSADCKVKILTFSDPQGKDVFRHSTAHILAHAIQRLFPDAKNTIGPPVEEGFYYDFADLSIKEEDFVKIEEEMSKVVKENLEFKKHDWKISDVKKHQGKNLFKLELAEEFKQKGAPLTAYSDGDFIDLCEGPHVPSTGYVKSIKLMKIAGAFWRGDSKKQQLTRIYGISFPSQKELKDHLNYLDELEKRDHRKIGKELDLWSFNDFSPGSPFYHPKGAIIYNLLLQFLREEYVKRGYQEVITPVVFNKKLWETSGHWQHYKQNMFTIKVEDEDFALKPMNCPSHILLFKSQTRSYRDLPLRLADFGVIHRNELTGALNGLFRTRKLEQDDSHIFATQDQIQGEIEGLIDFVKYVYSDVFKFEYSVELSTKPESALGDPKQWAQAESALANALKQLKIPFEVKAGEGAFYGPKIDVHIKDAIGRKWQCATIQLDFQQPQRFDVTYEGEDNKKHHVVMIHRAILGSLGRFIAILTEHFVGKFPLWLSPIQVRLLTVADRHDEYARSVASEMQHSGIRVDIDKRLETINKKVREAQMAQINYILVVGDKEIKDKTVTVRTRKNEIVGPQKVGNFIETVQEQVAEKRIDV